MHIVKNNQSFISDQVNNHTKVRKLIFEKVQRIVEDVRKKGDEALIEYTKKFDKVRLSSGSMKVTHAEMTAAFKDLNSTTLKAFKRAIENVRAFYKKQLPEKNVEWKTPEGKVLETLFVPLERVGVYIPAGQHPLVSTVYMCVIPAIIAGVKEIILVSPPTHNGKIHPSILAVASLLNIKQIYKIGGAQAIAALAFGTKTIPRVDKIVGPGNEYVTEAKRQVFGFVDIDMLAGPSEVVIVADKSTNPAYIIADVKAQAEHHAGKAIVITTSSSIAKTLKDVDSDAAVLVVEQADEAAELVNAIAPEHVEIMTKNPHELAKKIQNAGCIFIGEHSPTALGDYVAGSSHVLPTGRTARFFSGLSVYDFLKTVNTISYSAEAFNEEASAAALLAELEGLTAHKESITVRNDPPTASTDGQ